MMEPDELLVGLDSAQRSAVISGSAPLCILAGAGSGKTRVLTHRIAHRAVSGNLDPQRTLAITFTRKAAGELVERLSALGLPRTLTAGTFHSVAYAQLRGHWADQGVKGPTVLDKTASFVMRLLRGGPKSEFSDAIDIASEIEWAKARMVDPEQYETIASSSRRNPSAGIASVAEIYERYEEEKTARGLIDMSDLLDLYRLALMGDKAFRASQQWRFRHIFVDEFQDVNPAQNALLEALLGTRSDLCVVGDPNQAIYSFNGAEQSFLVNFASRLGPSATISLEHNYRSTPEILALGKSVLGRSAAGSVRPTLSNGQLPTVKAHSDERAEATAIARTLRDHHHKGDRWSEQAVLVRTNAQASIIADALTAADIPFRVRGVENHGSGKRDASQLTEAVDVSTFHAAKGLEWPVVHLAGMEKGLVPIAHARTPAAEAEESRLLYVAITRARRELHITWAQERKFGSRASQRNPSDYLSVIEETLSALTKGEDVFAISSRRRSQPAGASGKTASGRQPTDKQETGKQETGKQATGPGRRRQPRITGPDLDPAARDLFEALRAWRATSARAANVPAYVIFHDSTLEAVAKVAPKTLDELQSLPGLGPVKVGRYGVDILNLVEDHT